MKLTRILILSFALLVSILLISPSSAEQPVGGGQAWISMFCNVDGASVYFDNQYQGVISDGSLTVVVYPMGTPYKTWSVSKEKYVTATGTIPSMPGVGQTESLSATLVPVPVTTVGGNKGTIRVHCNVEGAQVFFDNVNEGEISGGVLNVVVYSTGTPFTSYTVKKSGYQTATGPIPSMPGNGQTENIYVTLNPVTPAQPVGGSQGWYQVNCNVNGATVMFDNTVVGTINQGSLTVPVYTTGTPYKTYTVSMNGYIPFTAPVPGVPAEGQTITLTATLNPAPTPAPTKSPLPVFIILTGIGAACLLAGWRIRK